MSKCEDDIVSVFLE